MRFKIGDVVWDMTYHASYQNLEARLEQGISTWIGTIVEIMPEGDSHHYRIKPLGNEDKDGLNDWFANDHELLDKEIYESPLFQTLSEEE